MKWSFYIILILFLISGKAGSQGTKIYDRMDERERMVQTQIIARGVEDTAVIRAMRTVPRHHFVPDQYSREAYYDHPLPIGSGQTISQPYIVAFMTEVLDLQKTDRVLEVGTGSGYQAAVLAEICDSVHSVEIIENLGERARKTLENLGYDNVYVRIGDGYEGWPEAAPFDAIIVTCSPTEIPDPLEEQLAEGGKMIIPVGNVYSQELYFLRKEKGKLKQKRVLPVRFVPMIREDGSKY